MHPPFIAFPTNRLRYVCLHFPVPLFFRTPLTQGGLKSVHFQFFMSMQPFKIKVLYLKKDCLPDFSHSLMEVSQSLSGPIPAQFDADAARYERGEQERQDGDGCQRPDDRVVSVGHVGHELPDVRHFALVRQQRRNYTVSQKNKTPNSCP